MRKIIEKEKEKRRDRKRLSRYNNVDESIVLHSTAEVEHFVLSTIHLLASEVGVAQGIRANSVSGIDLRNTFDGDRKDCLGVLAWCNGHLGRGEVHQNIDRLVLLCNVN